MARPKKFDYDSDDFYDEILALAMQGLTDAEIADSLADKFGVSLSPDVFSTMKNGCYANWTEKENQRRSRWQENQVEDGSPPQTAHRWGIHGRRGDSDFRNRIRDAC